MDSEARVTLQIVGPVVVGFCDDVPTLQSLLRARNQYVLFLEGRLKRERRNKNEWRQLAEQLEYKS